ncbi:MAG: hypothetical protein HS111_20350 [Kofleriaceae bacterium]|nr:hypothetical protein [Kofleriaceae bacterium]MCL4225324.1 hypothetical protein [Myxococcales bacterium]
MKLGRTTITLSAEEQAQLRAAVERDAVEFSPRLAHPLMIDRIDQPWFRRHRILDVSSALPFPARRVHVAAPAAGDGGMKVLTHHLEHLQAVAAHDPPLDLDDEERAAAYATYGNAWTRAYALGELKIGSFSDIPWFASLDAAQEATIADLARRFADAIAPEARRRVDDGWAFHGWVVAHRRLIERELVVPRDGQLRRTDTVHAEDLPLPAGNQWRIVNNRMIPVG